MFWKTTSATSSHLETLLNSRTVTLLELMNEEDLLQECKSQNKKLLEFLTQTNILEQLVQLTTVEPVDDDNNDTRYKYPNLACEILTCEVPQLTEKLAGDRNLLCQLYSFLETDLPLNPLLASFFSRTFGVLISRKSEQNWYSYQFSCLQVFDFLKSKENCVDLLLKHLGTSAIMDLLFNLITRVDDVNMKQNILTWLDEQKLVENIIGILDATSDPERHSNAAQLLCDVIQTARENQRQASEKPDSDPILDKIESPKTVAQLLNHILKEPKCETSIIGGISVLLTLLDCNKKDTNEINCTVYAPPPPTAAEDLSPEQNEPSPVVLSTIASILPRLKDFHDILLNPPVKPNVKTTTGLLEPPLGATRVEITRLLSVLVATNNEDINHELATLDTINVLLDLFFKYSWNNFLHTQVEQCLAYALNVEFKTETISEDSLVGHILMKCRLLQRILDAWKENEMDQTDKKAPRRGYMGHVIKISNYIGQIYEKGSIGTFVKETIDEQVAKDWEEFLNTTLANVNKTQQICLGGVHPNQQSSSEEDDADKGTLYPPQFYFNYQQQHQLAQSFNEQLVPFDEEQFNDTEDVLNSTVELNNSQTQSFSQQLGSFDEEQLNDSEYLLSSSTNTNEERKASAREQALLAVCAQKLQTLEDDECELWDNHNGALKWKSHDGGAEHSSSDEEEEGEERTGPEGREETHLENDAADIWSSGIETNVAPVVDSNPWSTQMTAGGDGFDGVPFVADFDFNFPPPSDINTTIATSVPNPESPQVPIPLDLTPTEMCEAFNELQTVQTCVGQILSCIAEDSGEQMQWVSNAVEQLHLEGAAGGSDQIVTNVDKQQESTKEEKNERIEESNVSNDRLNSSEGLISKEEQVSNSTEDRQVTEGEGDASRIQIENENVVKVENTLVPNENTNINSCVEASPPTTTNGPV